ncbi:hypothetical protein HMPREF1544_10619 [Mucor circinelloides 1006PhL]|uniref:Uncharacterized protein n=1 Tax=Mucor circinelloides f. circinelloides (strain 1006PhL) TaxID=1220926 RepID=S2IZB6_MUCC1|nr:hypothetical protein HMPREF1544_10619 [Mucor circinelloides 1006PhL]KAG1083281.1 hypothetical protein G6F42_022269 [Rhizopus arrhizus]
MPANAFTPWHYHVAHRSWCHRIVPDKFPSPVCALYGFFEENLYYFMELLPSDASFWLALTSFCFSGDLVVIDVDVLIALATAYSTL